MFLPPTFDRDSDVSYRGGSIVLLNDKITKYFPATIDSVIPLGFIKFKLL